MNPALRPEDGAPDQGGGAPSSTSAGPAFGVRDLTVRYGARVAIDNVSLSVPRGEITAVVGSDGSGKTTLARALVGALRPAHGFVSRPPSQKIGYISAATGAYRDLTVLENLAFSAGAYGVRGDAFHKRAAQLLERTGLTAARDRLGGDLSGGMRQKLAVAMALLHQPDLLVLDEPTTGLDPVSRAELWRLIAAAAAGGAAVLFTTCYLDEAERAATAIVLDRGAALLSGEPTAIVAATPGAMFAAPVGYHDTSAGVGEDASASARAARTGADKSAFAIGARPDVTSWRVGATVRIWSPGGETPPGTTRVPTSFADAVIVASLQRQESAA